jgi:hypothetical protein
VVLIFLNDISLKLIAFGNSCCFGNSNFSQINQLIA